MLHKNQNTLTTKDNLDDLLIGFDPRPLTKREQKMISAFIEKDKCKRRKNKITNT